MVLSQAHVAVTVLFADYAPRHWPTFLFSFFNIYHYFRIQQRPADSIYIYIYIPVLVDMNGLSG